MPKIPYVPPADVQTDLNRLVQALDTIVPAQRVPELIATRSNDPVPQLDPIMTD
jgi:hypothetical protein